jgi:hypothetical protein
MPFLANAMLDTEQTHQYDLAITDMLKLGVGG